MNVYDMPEGGVRVSSTFVKAPKPDEPVILNVGKNGKIEVDLGKIRIFKVADGLTIREGKVWKSSKSKIMTIAADGTATPLKVGKTKISIQVLAPEAKGKLKKKVASIIVNVVDPKALKSVKIAPIDQALKIGSEVQLKADVESINPYELTWKSSKPKIVAVDKATGKLTVLKKGKAKITATAKQGKVKKTASITLTIKE